MAPSSLIVWTPPDESRLPELGRRLLDAIHALDARGKAVEGLRIDVSAAAGCWIPGPIPKTNRMDLSGFSSHESIETGFLMEACSDALVSFATFLDPGILSPIHFSFGVEFHEGSWKSRRKIHPAAAAWSNLHCPSISIDSMAAALPNARDLLSSFGDSPFLPLPGTNEDRLAALVRERARPDERSDAAFSFAALSPRVPEEGAAKNAFRQAAFLSALKNGGVDMDRLDVSAFHVRPARLISLVSDARAQIEGELETARRLHRRRPASASIPSDILLLGEAP